jgi:hypothetical protein
MLYLPQKWGQQKPPVGTPLNTSHPLARELVGCWVLNEGGGSTVFDLSGNGHSGTITGADWSTHGLSFDETDADNVVNFGVIDFANYKEISVCASFKWVDSGQSDEFTIVDNFDVTNSAGFCLRVEDYPVQIETLVGATSSYSLATTSSNISSGQKTDLVLTYRSGGGSAIYTNGALASSEDDDEGDLNPTSSANPLLLGQSTKYPNDHYNGEIYYVYIFKRALTPAEIQSLYTQPYQMFDHQIWVPVGGGGGESPIIDCSTGAVVIGGLQADISAGTTIDCIVGSVEVTGLQADLGIGTTIDCIAGTISVSGLDADVSAGTTIDCSVGAVEVVGLQSDLSVGTTVDCSVGAVEISGINTELSVGKIISCTVGSVVVTGLQAEVDTENTTTINCTVGDVAIAGSAASIIAETIIDCTVGAVEIGGFGAEVSAGSVIDCSVGSVDIAGLVAEISFASTINCTTGAVAISGLRATVANDSTINCGVGEVSVDGLNANLIVSRTINCITNEITIAGYRAFIMSSDTPTTPESRTLTIPWQDRTFDVAYQDRTFNVN